MSSSRAHPFYVNGFNMGNDLGYQNGHREGYIMAERGLNEEIAQRDQRIEQLEAMLRDAHHKSSQQSEKYDKTLSNMERQWTADCRVHTDRLDELVCVEAEISDLKDQHEAERKEWENKVLWLEYDWQAARRAKHDVKTTLDAVQLELDTVQQHVTEKARQSYIATTNHCDKLILEIIELKKKNTNQKSMIVEHSEHVQMLCDQLSEERISLKHWKEDCEAMVDEVEELNLEIIDLKGKNTNMIVNHEKQVQILRYQLNFPALDSFTKFYSTHAGKFIESDEWRYVDSEGLATPPAGGN